ncbi:Gfo/Idh/MocA family protein [Paenibacillus cremeus]|uniref:Gfo/Idh/MocA family oxidoreductase n=1 Tax=Paenibacillus cremeus TaxID=2163881 RepID=A0A559K9U5_9BACL|nr:Gfo/Idh/MocA family oxidoreductase [Paenibacillus cremeus]TVY08894.1 Gfo/Idh/MocA family oxidoreductase [Paenibacillus cremeus]
MKNRYFSIIGCRHGHIEKFIQEMIELGYRCAGIYEGDEPSLAIALSNKYDIPFVTELEPVLAPGVSIVGTSAINHQKIELIEVCESLGKHIMLDKPLVTSRVGLNRLEAVLERNAIQVGLLLTSRDRRSIVMLKQKIDEGYLGDIVSITMRKPHKLTPSKRAPWHFSKEQNGGIIVDLLIHDFDLLRWLTGKEIAQTSSMMSKTILPEYPEFYDTAAVQVRLEGNVLAQLYTDWHTPEQCWTFGDGRIFVTGTKGSAELRLLGDPAIGREELMFAMTHEEKFHQVDLVEPSISVVEDFLQQIQGKPGLITHQDLLLASRAAIEADEQAVIWR